MKKEKDIKINIRDDEEMIANGLNRSRAQQPRDPNVWTKTNYEKKQLRKVRCHKSIGHFMEIPIKEIPFRDKLIVYLVKNKFFDKTTLSFECFQHEISRILSKFNTNKGSLVLKYSWNGRTFKPTELPVW